MRKSTDADGESFLRKHGFDALLKEVRDKKGFANADVEFFKKRTKDFTTLRIDRREMFYEWHLKEIANDWQSWMVWSYRTNEKETQ